MGATNKTTNYELPIFVGTDKPAWLVDWNGAMSDIDVAIKEAKTAADNAQTTANTATSDLSTLSGSVSTLSGTVASQGTAISGNTGAINTINSLIGNGEPTTQDKTIIGAINEIAAEIPSGTMAADHVTYDNTTSGLTADDVQEAIDELAASAGAPTAAQVSYDNTTSGLTADDVQEAIDELAAGGIGGITYSTSEVDTGDIWLDNKHIYRRVITATNLTSGADTNIDSTFTLSDVDTVVKMYGVAKTDVDIPISGISVDGSKFCRVTLESNGVHANVGTAAVTDLNVILEYTKPTTPTP